MEYSHWTLSSELDIGSYSLMGLYGVVGGTCYGLDGLGIESLWGENFRTRTDRSWGTPSPLYRIQGHSKGKGESGLGVALTTHPALAPRLKNQ